MDNWAIGLCVGIGLVTIGGIVMAKKASEIVPAAVAMGYSAGHSEEVIEFCDKLVAAK